jgi:hypothetical protein
LRRPGAANGACEPCSVREQTMVGVRRRMLSWVNFGGVVLVVLALHGSFGRGVVFARSRTDFREPLGWWR